MPGDVEGSIVPIVLGDVLGALELIGTGIVISDHAVITCRHVIEHSQTVLCGSELCHATRVRVSSRWDLVCLYFDRLPGVQPAPLFRASGLAGRPLFAAGFQEDVHDLRLHRIPKLEARMEEQYDGVLQVAQLTGGVPGGFSGAPVMVQAEEAACIVGMLWLGREKSATSRMIAADAIAAFLEEEPATGFSIHDIPDYPDCLRIPSRKWVADKHGPSAMLIAEYEVVPFGGRERELSDIVSWALGPGNIDIRLYHERGGVGKTRLAIEACKRLAKEKFRSGFLDRTASTEDLRQLFARAQSSNAPGLFVVVDYAESDSHRLRNLILTSGNFSQVQLRVMLLARGLGDWWEFAKCEGDGVAEVLTGPAMETPIRLGSLVISPEFRATELQRAAAAYATALGRKIPERTNTDLTTPVFERVLLLHIFALLMVLQIPFEIHTADSDPFLDALWRREKRFLGKVIQSRGMDLLLQDAVVMTLAAITAIEGVDGMADAIAVIRALPALKGTSELAIRAVARLLHDTYGGAKWIEPLQPDILAEYAVDKVFEDDPGGLNAVLTR